MTERNMELLQRHREDLIRLEQDLFEMEDFVDRNFPELSLPNRAKLVGDMLVARTIQRSTVWMETVALDFLDRMKP